MLVFTSKEKSAIARVAIMMQAADGHSDSAEKLMNTFTFENLDISKEELIYARDMSNI